MSDKRSMVQIVFEKSLKTLFRFYFRIVHRVNIEGLENIPNGNKKLIIIANHANFLDGPLLWAFLPLSFKVLVDRVTAQYFFLKPFMSNSNTIQIDPFNSYALKSVVDIVNKGTNLLVFPEGRRTSTGSIMKIYEGTGFIAYKTEAEILPVYINNTYNIIGSRKKGEKKFFAKITVTVGKVKKPIDVSGVNHKERKEAATSKIYQLLSEIQFTSTYRQTTLSSKFIHVCKENKKKVAFLDITGKEVNYKKALIGAFVLGDFLSRYEDKNIGILLPNLTSTMLVFFGSQISHKTPAFLNYSGGVSSLQQCMDLADLRTIVTSRQFLEKINIDVAAFSNKKLIYLEDIKEKVNVVVRLRGLCKSIFSSLYYKPLAQEYQETAVILFTSGSEGKPKGVCLSHDNILSNIYQSLSRIDIQEKDYLMNALPIFHSFGLTIGTLMPLFCGIKIFLYVSPLHYRVIPELVYDEHCTILLGTNTFLNGFAKKAHPYDFHSLRYIFCGAEALSDAVFTKYAKTYGIRVMSGYGATECAPVISINNAIEHEYGTVGKFLPGIEYKIMPVAGIDHKQGQAGKLYVRGPNIMREYLKNETANRKFQTEDKGWYDTGDIVEVANAGFLKIVGRMKRFAKVSGEMVSLTAVEEALAGMFGQRWETAVMTEPDEKKGERLILVANSSKIELGKAREILRTKGFAEITHPREIRYVKEIPKLGTGKVDYMKLQENLKIFHKDGESLSTGGYLCLKK